MAEITNEQKKYLLSLKPKDITYDILIDILGDIETRSNTGKLKVKVSGLNTTDTFTLRSGEYFVKTTTKTTVGKFLFNKFIIEYIGIQKVIGYVDWELTESGLNKLEAMLGQALLDDKITIMDFKTYIDRRDSLGSHLHAVICPSLTMDIIKTPKAIVDEKERLLKENREKLQSGDIVAAEQMEKKLLQSAREILKDDPAMNIYNSGAQGSFNNNYKNINLLKGPVFNNITGKYDFVESSFMDGIKKQDIPTLGNAVVAGSYPKSVGTQVSGYFAKQILAALQTEMLDVVGSDCGTKRPIEFIITKRNSKDFEYRYIVEGTKLIELTPNIISRYYGKTVKLRTPMTCIGDRLCHHCAGNLFYKLGIENIGLTSSRVATTLTNLGMKKFHDSTVNAQKIDLSNILI